MDTTRIYAMAAGGILFGLALTRVVSSLMSVTRTVSVLISKHLTYPYLLDRHYLIGPWTRANILLSLAYGAINIFCVSFRLPSAADAGQRAGTLSLINMAFLFLATHLSFLADILGVSLQTCRRFHRAAGWMAGALLTFHILMATMVQHTDFSLRSPNNLFAIIVWPMIYLT
jgi:hypothetical protein